jgi:hypothetical protein
VLAFSAGGELLIHEGIDVRPSTANISAQIGPTQAGDSFLFPLVPPRTMTRNGQRKLASNPGHARHVSADLIYLA